MMSSKDQSNDDEAMTRVGSNVRRIQAREAGYQFQEDINVHPPL